jgi:hypothetical protein
MLFKSKFFRVTSVFCLALTMTVAAFGDTIRLKDGSIIKGKIISFGGGKFVVSVNDGTRQRQMNFTANEVESIAFDNDSMSSPTVQTTNNNSGISDKNSTVITVGQKTPKTVEPQISTPKINIDTTTQTTPKPIEIGVKVLADNTANGWTNSGWVVKKGQKIRITGNGRVSLGGGRYTTPGGISSLSDKDKLMANEATGGLIAVIGDNNNDFIFIGDSREFVATHDGALFLGVNEGNLTDNSGAFDVKVEIDPEIGY